MERKYIYDFLVEHNIPDISEQTGKTADELESLSPSELRNLFVENSKYLVEDRIRVDSEYYKDPEYSKENDKLYAQFAARQTIVVRGETKEECDKKAKQRFEEAYFGDYEYVEGCELKCESEEIQLSDKTVFFDELVEGLKDGSVNIRYEGYINFYDGFDEYVYKLSKGDLDAKLNVSANNDIIVDFCGLAYRYHYQYDENSDIKNERFQDALRIALERDDAEMAEVIYCESNKYRGVLYDTYYSDNDIYRAEALSRKREIDESLKTKASIERD
jgi:hypothetical protein